MNNNHTCVTCQECGKKYKVKKVTSIKAYSCKHCGSKIFVSPFQEIFNQYDERIKRSKNFVIPISTLMLEDAFRLADNLNEVIQKNFRDNDEIRWRYHLVFFQSICFSMHLMCRFIQKNYGIKTTDKFMDLMAPALITYTILNFFKATIETITKKQESFYYNFLQNSEDGFSICNQLIINPNEDIAYADKIAAGKKSCGLMNQQTDTIFEILEEKNPLTYIKIFETVGTNYDIYAYEKTIKQLYKYL